LAYENTLIGKFVIGYQTERSKRRHDHREALIPESATQHLGTIIESIEGLIRHTISVGVSFQDECRVDLDKFPSIEKVCTRKVNLLAIL
jgi:hypothetical protein